MALVQPSHTLAAAHPHGPIGAYRWGVGTVRAFPPEARGARMVEQADLVLAGGTVLTMDPRNPEAEAVAFHNGNVLRVGRASDVLVHAGDGTRIVEVPEDAVVLPGFVDAHTHPVNWGMHLLRLNLRGAPHLEEVLSRVKDRVEMTPEGGWVVGHGWDESTWPGDPQPTRNHLDEVAPEHPVLLERVDMHMGVVNTRALEELGWSREDHPRGHLREDVFYDALEAVTPAPATRVKAVERMSREALRHGCTSMHAIVDGEDLEVLERARQEGSLGVRITGYVRRSTLPTVEAGNITVGPDPTESLLRVQGLKLFADGSLGSHTAALEEGYADAPGERGELLHTTGELADLMARGHAVGLQPMVHAIGDRAIGQVLDALEASRVPPGARPRVEHAELARDGHVRRFAGLGAVASMQPNFVGEWSRKGGLYEERLGPDHHGRDNRFRVLLDADVPLCFGSDNMPFGPLYGVHWAVNAPHRDQRVTVEEALRAYTAGAAWAGFEEDAKGILREGFLGDAVVLGEDPREVPERLEELPVLLTVRGGEVVYEAR